MKITIRLIYKRIIFLLFILFSLSVYSQSYEEYVNDIIPPSPEAQSMTKYGNTSVNLYNGIPDVSIPIWNYKGKKIYLPIQLQYNGGGIKVNEIASSVGLGWSLSAGGLVSREVRGLPDDMATYGYLYAGSLTTPSNSTSAGKLIGYNYMMNKVDSQQDVFNVRFNGHAFSFVITKSGAFLLDPVSNVEIEKVTGTMEVDARGNITGWRIKDENGVLYKFEEREFSKYMNNSESNSYFQNKYFVTSWYLTEITSPDNNETISLSYETYYPNYYTSTSETYTGGENIEIISTTSIISKKIKTISCPNQNVTFTYDPNGYRADLTGEKALTSISVSDGTYSKNFNLSYVYMNGSGGFTAYSAVSSGSSNNLYYRLTLKEVEEGGSNPYIFDYISGLPSRDSKSQDHWGFYNGQNNSTLLPLTYYYAAAVGYLSVGSANRKVNPTYTSKGTLNKLTYPTGGTTEFAYENNETCSPYVDHKNEYKSYMLTGTNTTGSVEIEVSNFTAPYTTFTFELQFLPLSFEDDACELFFSIRDQATQNDVVSLSFTKAEFDNDENVKEVQALLENGTYDFVYYYSPSGLCYLDDPFSCTLCYTNETDDSDRYGGGIRIKTITDKLSDGTAALTKNYEYVDEADESSGYILNYPSYITLYNNLGDVVTDIAIYFGSLTSDSKISLQNTKGGPVGYSRVVEYFSNSKTDNGYTEYIYTTPNNYKDYYAWHPVSVFPFCPATSFENFRGRLLKKNIYNSSGQLVQIERNHYTTSYTWEDQGVPNIKVGREEGCAVNVYSNYYFWQIYSSVSTLNQLESTTVVDYFANDSIVRTYNYTYENTYNKLRNRTWSTSRNEKLKESYYYPFDYTSGTNVYQLMVNGNILDPIVKKETSIDNDNNGTYDETIDGQLTNYAVVNTTSYLPSTFQKLEGSTYITKLAFDSYNSDANPVQFHKLNDYNSVYLWDATGQCVMAKVENATYSEISSLDGKASTYNSKTLYTSIKNIVSDAIITTYSYQPLWGVTQQTDPTGVTTYYLYDSYGRLEYIKDDDSKLLKKYVYHYE
ncbi:MAG: hypothetical protein JXR36_16525 [Bacteroidales bacterium]|nr:hypothetical protein [Bacteroidales bacterium]